jgi:hypothetical protein
MLEIIAALTLLLLVAFAAAAAWAFRRLLAAYRLLGMANGAEQYRVANELEATRQEQREGYSMLREAIEQLPKKGKPGRKPSSATGAKRGPKPKVPLALAPTAPAPLELPPAPTEDKMASLGSHLFPPPAPQQG